MPTPGCTAASTASTPLTATALAAPGPTTVLTSDPDDLTALAGERVTVITV